MRAAVVALVSLTVVGLAGCGGGGGPSHRDFVQDAGSICQEANQRFARVEIVSPTATRAEAALGDIVEIGAIALRDLRRVKPPKGDASEAAAWLAALEQALDEVDYARTLLRDGDVVRAVAAIARADVLTRRARKLARATGVARVCQVPELLPGA